MSGRLYQQLEATRKRAEEAERRSAEIEAGARAYAAEADRRAAELEARARLAVQDGERRAAELEKLLEPMVAAGKAAKGKISEAETRCTALGRELVAAKEQLSAAQATIQALQAENESLKAKSTATTPRKPLPTPLPRELPTPVVVTPVVPPPLPPALLTVEDRVASAPVPVPVPAPAPAPAHAPAHAHAPAPAPAPAPVPLASPLRLSASSSSSSSTALKPLMTSPHALSPGIMSSQVPGLVTKKTPSAALIEVVDPSEDVKPEGCTKSLAEIKSLLGVLINHAEAVPESERQPAVQNWISKFAKSPQSLEAIVALYPFLVEEHPLHPALAYQKMKAWEDHLFSKLGNPADVAKMRKSKSVEIRKSKPEDVPQLAAAAFASREKAAATAAKLKSQISQASKMSSVLEDIRKRGEEAEKRRLEELRKAQAAGSQGQDEEIDFGN